MKDRKPKPEASAKFTKSNDKLLKEEATRIPDSSKVKFPEKTGNLDHVDTNAESSFRPMNLEEMSFKRHSVHSLSSYDQRTAPAHQQTNPKQIMGGDQSISSFRINRKMSLAKQCFSQTIHAGKGEGVLSESLQRKKINEVKLGGLANILKRKSHKRYQSELVDMKGKVGDFLKTLDSKSLFKEELEPIKLLKLHHKLII